jgi:hypothetical protein
MPTGIAVTFTEEQRDLGRTLRFQSEEKLDEMLAQGRGLDRGSQHRQVRHSLSHRRCRGAEAKCGAIHET